MLIRRRSSACWPRFSGAGAGVVLFGSCTYLRLGARMTQPHPPIIREVELPTWQTRYEEKTL